MRNDHPGKYGSIKIKLIISLAVQAAHENKWFLNKWFFKQIVRTGFPTRCGNRGYPDF